MRIISHRRLKDFHETKGREDSCVALERWYHIALKAKWKNLHDVKIDFPAVDYTGNQHYKRIYFYPVCWYARRI
jgi:mRNA interferase HigB